MSSTHYSVYRVRPGEQTLDFVADISARSGKAAVRLLADADGDYVAIPTRSLAPHRVTTKTTTVVTVS